MLRGPAFVCRQACPEVVCLKFTLLKQLPIGDWEGVIELDIKIMKTMEEKQYFS